MSGISIKSELDYQSKLKKLNTIFNAKSGSKESDEADVLAEMIEEYEKKHFLIEKQKR
ncbi:MAG: hypothetical protein H7098_02020 [Oligoflexus sp.]|nr:hypothetical protein [Pseudopedobacter sp.]